MKIKTFLIGVTITSVLMAHDDATEIRTDTFHYSVENRQLLEVEFSYGLGEFVLGANPKGNAIDGTITYAVEKIIPDVRYIRHGAKGILTVDMESIEDQHEDDELNFSFDLNVRKQINKYKNDIDFLLPSTVPTELELDFGLGSAHLDFTGIRLSSLDIDCGLSDVFMTVSDQNPIRCKKVQLSNGLGDIDIRQLGNLRAENIDIEVGLGSASIDFRGQQIYDMNVDIEIGLGAMDIILPENTNIRIEIYDNFLSSVEIRDMVKKDDSHWVSPDWKAGRPTIRMSVEIGLGSIDIDLRN
ncbi:MAG: hypothetical protein H8E64_01760 [Candidatus Marinimicrobia bacterium]|nr:hypothetical protein [Candidatus Neomarinimicrobiota bacterium]